MNSEDKFFLQNLCIATIVTILFFLALLVVFHYYKEYFTYWMAFRSGNPIMKDVISLVLLAGGLMWIVTSLRVILFVVRKARR